MNTDRSLRATRPAAWLLLALLCSAAAHAQTPAPAAPPATPPATPPGDGVTAPGPAPALGSPIGAAPGPGTGPMTGRGPGYHDPRSAFKPLQERDGVVSWSVLSSVTTKVEKNRLVPVFPKPVQALHDETVKVQGFMMPLEPGKAQKHFLLSSVPTSCSFCVPAGPEGLIEVRSRTPVAYTLDPVVVQGTMAVLSNDPFGVYYRIVDAAAAP